MKIMVLRNVFIGGKFFAEGERPDVAEKDAKTLIAMKKARALTAGDAEAIEFQSTPLHEGRPPKKQSFEVVAYFKRNPRTVGKNRRFRLPSLL